MIEDKKNTRSGVKAVTQNLIIENREKISISGVLDVESFDDESIVLHTELGVLIIKGYGLHINKLDIDSGELSIEGDIVSCTYSDDDHGKSKGLGFLAKMFR
ncbi:MAG: sporulation protein YabP [Clostridiaceae bacterium]|nr:sporulation protein YabP [Clostridiaceae bacterium]